MEKQKVRIKAVETTCDKRLYELEPIDYTGPWELEEGAVLEVVGDLAGEPSTPTEGNR